jgi:hypothetical protein
LPGLTSNYDLPDLCLPKSWDYRCELPLPPRVVSKKNRKEKVGIMSTSKILKIFSFSEEQKIG